MTQRGTNGIPLPLPPFLNRPETLESSVNKVAGEQAAHRSYLRRGPVLLTEFQWLKREQTTKW